MYHKDQAYDTLLIMGDYPIINLLHLKVIGKIDIATGWGCTL